jgi:hypothetical protein
MLQRAAEEPGQWLFACYVGVVFGARVAADGLAGLSQVRLMHGYVAGDTLGNFASTAHILLAIVIHGGGPLQLIDASVSTRPLSIAGTGEHSWWQCSYRLCSDCSCSGCAARARVRRT